MARPKSVATIWPSVMVTIDYVTASMASLIKACNFPDGYVNQEIVKIFKLMGQGKVGAKIEFVHFNRWLSITEMLEELEKQGFDPALPEQLVAAAAADEKLGLEFPVVALGPRARGRSGGVVVVMPDGSGYGRCLCLHRCYRSRWHDYWRVAAVRKSRLGT